MHNINYRKKIKSVLTSVLLWFPRLQDNLMSKTFISISRGIKLYLRW